MIALHKKNLSDEADIRFCIRTKFTKEEETAQAEFQMECDELKNKVSGLSMCWNLQVVHCPQCGMTQC